MYVLLMYDTFFRIKKGSRLYPLLIYLNQVHNGLIHLIWMVSCIFTPSSSSDFESLRSHFHSHFDDHNWDLTHLVAASVYWTRSKKVCNCKKWHPGLQKHEIKDPCVTDSMMIIHDWSGFWPTIIHSCLLLTASQ